ncbi:hypothetical protein C4579_03380 [Candidatus Microgenomates bacterium]|nr:MAG: hypothetical protein C4579_03380 [Candidatus Microgenomates bacterium]
MSVDHDHAFFKNRAARMDSMHKRNKTIEKPLTESEMHVKYIRRVIGETLMPVLKTWAAGFSNEAMVIEGLLEQQMMVERPVQAMAFWGASRKPSPDSADAAYMDRLGRLQSAVSDVYPFGLQIEILLADVHAGFNGKGKAGINYLNQIGVDLKNRGMNPQWLSDAYAAAGIQLPEVNGIVMYESPAWDVLVQADRKWGSDNNPLVKAAAAHNERGLAPRIAAYHYLEMRLLERDRLFPIVYPDAIHIAYSSGELGKLILSPKQSVLYTGARIPAPWFTQGGVV